MAALELAEELVVEIVSVGQHHQRRVLHRTLADHPGCEEQHGETLAAALRVPDHARPPVARLAKYRYMIGMERFDSDKAKLYTHPTFDQALNTVRQNLSKGMNHTSKVYEVVMPDLKLAVFGVAMNGPNSGERPWVKANGAEHVAALPWEIYIVNGNVYALYGRYRTALAWPNLGLGEFMRISDHPDTVQAMLSAVAGGREERFNAF